MNQSETLVRKLTRQIQAPHYKRKAFADYQPTSHDVFVCAYSKSGTYWALQIALQITYYGEARFDNIHHLIPWPEKLMSADFLNLNDPGPQQKSPTGLRVIKTHLESDYVPYSPDAKYIVMMRDPKDVFVSSYYFGQGLLNAMGVNYDVVGWLKQFTSDHFFFDSWAAHVASYWAWRNCHNVLILTFSKMKHNLRAACQQIAGLMQVTLTEKQLDSVVAKSSFQYMKSIDHKLMPEIRTLGRFERPNIMRRGKNGVAGELLNPSQQARLDLFCQSELKRLGSDLPYKSMFGAVRESMPSQDEVAR